jgi:hypothetical protein
VIQTIFMRFGRQEVFILDGTGKTKKESGEEWRHPARSQGKVQSDLLSNNNRYKVGIV